MCLFLLPGSKCVAAIPMALKKKKKLPSTVSNLTKWLMVSLFLLFPHFAWFLLAPPRPRRPVHSENKWSFRKNLLAGINYLYSMLTEFHFRILFKWCLWCRSWEVRFVSFRCFAIPFAECLFRFGSHHRCMSHTSFFFLRLLLSHWCIRWRRPMAVAPHIASPRSHLSTINRFQIVINLFFSIVNFAFYFYCWQ